MGALEGSRLRCCQIGSSRMDLSKHGITRGCDAAGDQWLRHPESNFATRGRGRRSNRASSGAPDTIQLSRRNHGSQFHSHIPVASKNQSNLNFASLACALERFHLAHHEYPETLAALSRNSPIKFPMTSSAASPSNIIALPTTDSDSIPWAGTKKTTAALPVMTKMTSVSATAAATGSGNLRLK